MSNSHGKAILVGNIVVKRQGLIVCDIRRNGSTITFGHADLGVRIPIGQGDFNFAFIEIDFVRSKIAHAGGENRLPTKRDAKILLR